MERLVTRRRFNQEASALVLASLTGLPEARQAYVIETVSYQPTYGGQSINWAPGWPGKEVLEATGLNSGGAADKYDALDIIINGGNSKASIRKYHGFPGYTREFLSASYNDLFVRDPSTREWAGGCYGAVAVSWFGPLIGGPINILGYEFSEAERKIIATWRYWGSDFDPYYNPPNPDQMEEIRSKVINGEPVGLNVTDVPGQEWWELAVGVDEDGNFITTRYLRWHELGLQREVRSPWSVSGAGVFHDRPHPVLRGNYFLLNHEVVGLIIGTHRLVQ